MGGVVQGPIGMPRLKSQKDQTIHVTKNSKIRREPSLQTSGWCLGSLSCPGEHPSQVKAVMSIIVVPCLDLGGGLSVHPFQFVPVESDETSVSLTLSSGKLLPPLCRGLPAGIQVYLLYPGLDVPSIRSALPHFQVMELHVHVPSTIAGGPTEPVQP